LAAASSSSAISWLYADMADASVLVSWSTTYKGTKFLVAMLNAS